jgi:predicted transcriptional regulator
MRLSENEILALVLITRSEVPLRPHDLHEELGLQNESVSRIITGLQNIGLVERAGGEILLARTAPAEAFKRLYYSHRASPLQEILSGQRVALLSQMDSQSKSLEDLAKATGISSDTVYYYLQGLRSLGIVSRSKQGKAYLYSCNNIVWPELKDFVTALLEFQMLRLVPREALLIKSYGDHVLFKSLKPQEATPTSFSAYNEYGIDLGLRDNYYTLPKRELSVKEILIQSLDSADSISQRLYCILFYLKNKEALKKARHPMMKSIRAVLRGEHIKGYPSLEEIEEQAELYGIQDIEP